jgi:hypothetical protein
MRSGRCRGFAKLIDARGFQSIVFTINLLRHFTLMRTGFGVWQNGLQTGRCRTTGTSWRFGVLAFDPFRIMVSQSMLAEAATCSGLAANAAALPLMQ